MEASKQQHVVVIGFGVPGRLVVEQLQSRSISFSVIEMNAQTVERCTTLKEQMIQGDAREAESLQRAGVERATLIVIAIPDERAAIEITRSARSLNSSATIIARCHYTSKGMEAVARGANEVVVAETVVAQEMARVVEPHLR